MTPARIVVLELTRIEAAHLSGLVGQFAQLLDESASIDDPAIGRLVPDAYVDDADASREFRELTEGDLLSRRRADAAAVLESLRDAADIPDDPESPLLVETTAIRLDPASVRAWMRTLAAIRLVLANRLGIEGPEDHDDADPRFGIYDWLGYRLHGLVTAAEDEG